MKNKKLLWSLIIVLILSIGMTGCQKAAPAAGTDPASEVKDTVTFAINGEVTSLDPYFTQLNTDYTMYSNVFDTLIRENEAGEFTPSLAESWTISDDGMSYTFKLKSGIKFHNGEELKASDVVFTANKAKESPYAQTLGELIEKATAIDDYTVQIDIKRPYAPFMLAIKSFFIQNEKSVKEAGEAFGMNPIGTGPYKFVKYDLGQSVVFEKYDDHFNGPANIKNLVYKIIPDANTALLAFESGEVDYLFNIPQIAYQSIKNNDKYTVTEFETGFMVHLILNLAKKPTDNVLVRKALNHVVDKSAIIQMALEGLGSPAEYVLNERTFGYSKNVKGYGYNVEKAKELLAEAGYPNGYKTTIKTAEGYKKQAEIIQEQLSKAGIEAEIQLNDQTALMEDLSKGNFDIIALGAELELDADFWSYFFKTGDILNFAPYNNPKVDELYMQGQLITDRSERLKIYEELYQIISDDAVIVPLYFPLRIRAANAKLQCGGYNYAGEPYVNEMSW